MRLTNDDYRILVFLFLEPESTSTQITKNVTDNKDDYQLRTNNSKINYRLKYLSSLGLLDEKQRKYSVTDKVDVGEARIMFKGRYGEVSVGVGKSLFILHEAEYKIIKLEGPK